MGTLRTAKITSASLSLAYCTFGRVWGMGMSNVEPLRQGVFENWQLGRLSTDCEVAKNLQRCEIGIRETRDEFL